MKEIISAYILLIRRMNCYGLLPTKLFATYSAAAKGPTWTEIWPYCLVGKGGHLCEHAYHIIFYVVKRRRGGWNFPHLHLFIPVQDFKYADELMEDLYQFPV